MQRVSHVSPSYQESSPQWFIADGDVKVKKRRADEPPSGSKAAPPKKATPPAPTTKLTTTTKKASAKTGVKDAKSDSSFFSAPKPKPKLPDFKKAPAVVKKEPDPNVAQPSSYNPFEEIVKSMKPRRDSPAVATPPPTAPGNGSQVISIRKSGKKKTVTWAPDGQLESIKLIERAVYDDDSADVSTILIASVMYSTLTLCTYATIFNSVVVIDADADANKWTSTTRAFTGAAKGEVSERFEATA